VIGGTAGGVGGLNEVSKLRFLHVRALQQEQHPAGGQGILHRSLVRNGARQRVLISGDADARGIIDEPKDTRLNLRRRGGREAEGYQRGDRKDKS